VPVEEQKVSRLPPLPQPLDPILQEMFAKRRAQGGDIINLQIATGHAPKFTRAASGMAFTIRFDATTPRKLLELVIMRTAQIVGSAYEINQHVPLIKMCGYSDAQIAALPAWKTSTLFDDKERAVLGYVEAMAHGGDVDDPTFASMQKFFTTQEIVEITYTVGSYYANGLLTKALRIEVETDGRLTVAGKC
jgi:alkylhydroperoxidase family enzyme